MSQDIYDDPRWKKFAADVNARLLPMITDSSMTISLIPEDGQADIKFAVELGLSIMLDKPIIAVVVPGSHVPDHLVRVADRIVEADLRDARGSEQARQRISAAINDMTEEIAARQGSDEASRDQEDLGG